MAIPPSHSQSVLPNSKILLLESIERDENGFTLEVWTSQLPHCPRGVDDWAWRKGQDYGTILVDLERHRVADLLPGRSAEELADWLTQHPTVNIISRDRSGLYAEGSQLGAPGATQVADRFHLVLNMSTAIERALEERSSQLQLPAAKPADSEPASPTMD